MHKILFLFLLLFIATSASAGHSTSGKVISVIDGNTVEVMGNDNEMYRIVLAGIDSPELTQAYGDKAKEYLERMVFKKEVTVLFQGKDRKGNHVAVILLKGKIDPRIELLKEGLAWTSENDPLPELETHRMAAQGKGKGLWKDEKPTPPWTYRRQQSMMQPKSS